MNSMNSEINFDPIENFISCLQLKVVRIRRKLWRLFKYISNLSRKARFNNSLSINHKIKFLCIIIVDYFLYVQNQTIVKIHDKWLSFAGICPVLLQCTYRVSVLFLVQAALRAQCLSGHCYYQLSFFSFFFLFFFSSEAEILFPPIFWNN